MFHLFPVDARRVAVLTALGVSTVMSVALLPAILTGGAADFDIFREAGRRVWGGDLYAEMGQYAYRWSPVLAYVLGPLTALGPWAWRVLQVALAATMPSRLLTIVVLLANPFWFDVWLGNINILVLWLAAWGLTGRRWAVVGYLVLAVLVPRPLVIPLAVWFLWKEPWVRLPFAAMFGLHALGVVASGWGDEWLARLLATTGHEMLSPYNYGPSQFIGLLWLPIGLVLGAVAWHRGRPALAGLFVAPYWLRYYFLLPLAELAPRREATSWPLELWRPGVTAWQRRWQDRRGSGGVQNGSGGHVLNVDGPDERQPSFQA